MLAALASAQQTLTIKEIVVRGNSRISTEVITASIRSAQGRPFIEADLARDQQSLRALGVFQDVKISSRQLSDTEVQVVIDVSENPVVKEISIIGNTALKTDDLMKVITQPVGQVLNLNNRKTTADAIRELYATKGYFADVDFPTMADAPETLVVMVIETTVNDIVITGANRTRKYVLDRLMKTEPGKPFNQRTWISDVRKLQSTQWFESINPSQRATGEIGRFDLLLDLKEQRTAIFDVGLALDPNSRLAGTIRVSDSNFRGSGQQVSLGYVQDTFGSGASVSLDFTDPFFDKKDTALSVSLFSRINSYFTSLGGDNQLDDDSRFDERRTGGSLSLSRGYRGIYSTSIGLNYEDIRTVNENTAGTFIQQDGTLLKFLIQGTRDTRDVPLDPFQGDYLRLAIEPGFTNITKIGGVVSGYPDVQGKGQFLRGTLEYKAFFSKTPKPKPGMTEEEIFKLQTKPRPVIATRARVGTVRGTIPFFEQFFAGGADSLRGYDDQRFWGRNVAMATAELRYPIQENFSVIGFMDYGGAWGGYGTLDTDNDGSLADERFTQSDKINLKMGYGVGIGFRSPLGLIRIDFGFTPQGRSRTHFTIGGAF